MPPAEDGEEAAVPFAGTILTPLDPAMTRFPALSNAIDCVRPEMLSV